MPLGPTIHPLPRILQYSQIHKFTAILSIRARAYEEDKEATTRQRQIQHLNPGSRFSTRKLDMITIPDKNS